MALDAAVFGAYLRASGAAVGLSDAISVRCQLAEVTATSADVSSF